MEPFQRRRRKAEQSTAQTSGQWFAQPPQGSTEVTAPGRSGLYKERKTGTRWQQNTAFLEMLWHVVSGKMPTVGEVQV